ncbi:MAG: hypothetical protein COT74_05905 [Bdellovibrionales bacterium CG10_big_fil_rev_8_21_14_0_10_45_34]|nr:MAG: hypothetical protein COT74_05905 [Bdellovibrionales bacterium CG10_big_fil_rev_8_21_14_0_10_45_34]
MARELLKRLNLAHSLRIRVHNADETRSRQSVDSSFEETLNYSQPLVFTKWVNRELAVTVGLLHEFFRPDF